MQRKAKRPVTTLKDFFSPSSEKLCIDEDTQTDTAGTTVADVQVEVQTSKFDEYVCKIGLLIVLIFFLLL